MKLKNTIGAALLGAMAVLLGAGAQAQERWWPAAVKDMSGKAPVALQYQPGEKATKPWRICALFPHMKDTIWLAVNYGIVEEARRQGVAVTIYQAGGYENLPRQLSQFDDCMAAGFDALVVGAISEAGLARKFREAEKAGKPVIAVLNPVDKAPTASKVFADNVVMGESTGSFLAQHVAGKQTNIVALPGPAGSGWAEQFAQGLKKAVAANKHLRLVDEKFGDTGVAVQLRLVQNALQANPDLNVLWGNATMIEGAIGALREANRKDVLLIAEYENQAMLDALKSGQILGFATQYPVLQGRIAVDLAIKALQKEKVPSFVAPVPAMVTTSTLPSINTSLVLAPASFQAVYSVAAPAK
ncbi:MAG TPA: TMAO reductase system periplasmic protein TorT [Aquabacterium sp.]|jgi:protein TorT|uniref:TMAO reductase system periplasmic protein TorT n=1 Tax=Comamonadaceae TaxID=80864 RepID=UPI001FCC1FAE|nr:TMAO reductase system periplasmic protein TorT [Delftia lacustris]BDE73544.1 TMAO reductase system periplasmic protein TorT [Delftia lacustris]HQC99750.1 TMAO reductase system periplasmic protein TorT [Aquabacterium sp.]HQP68684.1 TMAO reductase system periplasmic protein TorT [Quisquiliibacterium sp.]